MFSARTKLGIWLFVFDYNPLFSVVYCRWGRSGPRQEQVRCTGLWHSAEGGPKVPAPLTARHPWLVSLSELQQHPSYYWALPSDRPFSTSMQGNFAKCLHFYHWNKVTIRTSLFFLSFFPRRILLKNEEATGSPEELRDNGGRRTFNSNATTTTNDNDSSLLNNKNQAVCVGGTIARLDELGKRDLCSKSLLFLRCVGLRRVCFCVFFVLFVL